MKLDFSKLSPARRRRELQRAPSVPRPLPASEPPKLSNCPPQNGEANTLALPGYPVAEDGGPFTPYCAPMSPETLASIRVELVDLIDKLSTVEGWSEAHRARLVETVSRQPLSSLRDDLAYFRARWRAHDAVQRAADGGRRAVDRDEAIRNCATCSQHTSKRGKA